MQGKPQESLRILESLLECPELLLFVHLRHRTLQYMVYAYVGRGQLSRALRANNLAVDFVPDEDKSIKAELALKAAHIYLVQSHLSAALPSLHSSWNFLQAIHYQGYMMSSLHLSMGQYALACGNLDGAEVELNIALGFLNESPTSHNANMAKVRLARMELCRQR